MNGVVELADADAVCGRKAAALAVLLRAGLPVPAGVVVLPSAAGWDEALLKMLGAGPFAVRSSATFEDGHEASFAGQLSTMLHVEHEHVLDSVRLVAASVREPGVRTYAAAHGVRLPDTVPVVVQEMVDPEAAGVLFADPARRKVIIEAVPGLGDAVVDGRATPERWVVAGQTHLSVERHGPGVLTERVVAQLCDLADKVMAATGGGPQDIEWALDGGGLWILQSRPITRPVHDLGKASEPPGVGVLTGLGASPGQGAGPVHVVRTLDDLRAVAAGDVLVCRTTSPTMTTAMLRASAVVTETGGLLSHAAIVAREVGIPAVVGLADATVSLAAAGRVHVDGTTGAVTVLGDGEDGA